MADEQPPAPTDIASKRRKAEAAPAPSSSSTRKGSSEDGERKEKRPPLWRWFSTQVAHSDSARAKAARAVRERWDLPTVRFSKIERALASEDSEHLVPFRMLLDEYRITFGIGDDDEDFARETGMAGLLVPFGPELCDQCTRDAVPGTGKCARHGGQWLSPQDMQSISHRLHDRLLAMSEGALRVLQDLMDNGRSEQVRMMAATTVLDRAGIGPHMNVHHSGQVNVTGMDEAAAALRDRLDRLALNAREKTAILEAARRDAEDVEDAEIVSEVVEK